ncbi:MAG: hypothetical protein U0359_36110 [Byssovorax sp.]
MLTGCGVVPDRLPGLPPDEGAAPSPRAYARCGESAVCGSPRDPASRNGAPDNGPIPCVDGKTRPCKIILGEHNGVTDCMSGVQICEDGAWGDVCTVPGAQSI